MKKLNITKRDVKFFLFGVLFMFLFEMIYEWKEVKRAFNDGWKDATETSHVVNK